MQTHDEAVENELQRINEALHGVESAEIPGIAPNLERIANALERIAAALEPEKLAVTPSNAKHNVHTQLALLVSKLR